MTEKDFQFLKWKVRRLIGIDLDAYKPEQMRRRINNFVQYKASGDYASFCRTIERNEELLRDFADMLTINVTEFFRDSPVFENLGQEVLPALLQEKSSLKIWSAGCSRGSEAYTVAMLLEGLGGSSPHSIVATDIDKAALTTARQAGPYAPAEVKNVPHPLLARYFKAEQGRYFMTIKPRVRFLEHNLLEDAFERGFDLILCRNVMIYFTAEARRSIMRSFFDALRPGGMLLLGTTEAIMPADNAGMARIGPSLYRKPVDPPSSKGSALPHLSSLAAQ